VRIHRTTSGLLVWGLVSISFVESAVAQTPVKPPVRAAAPSSQVVEANLLQLMRGTLYPASNVVFAAQDKNPNDVVPAKDPSVAVNPLESTYGKWQAVENAALAMAEVANLLTLPGRKCANGRDVPLKNPDWAKFVQGLRDAGMKSYAAAQTKDQDKIIEVTDALTTACADCHNKYREKPNLADRCQ
jgi:hypothetical protein